MSAWSTSGMKIARRSAAIRPAKPPPTGIVTPCSTSSSIPLAARARSSSPLGSSSRIAAVSAVQRGGHALEQLGQQLVLGQVGQRGVGDALERLQAQAGVALLREQVRVLDGERRAVGGELEQLAVVGRELARGQAADVQHAERPALDEQRDAEQRADALLAQDRVEDVGVVDVGDRRSARRSATMRPAKPRPTGIAHALLDLLLDAPWPLGRAASCRRAPASGSPPCRCAGSR